MISIALNVSILHYTINCHQYLPTYMAELRHKQSHFSNNWWLTNTKNCTLTSNLLNELASSARNNVIQWKYNLKYRSRKIDTLLTETHNDWGNNWKKKTHLLKQFSVGMTIGSDPGVVRSLLPVRDVCSGEESLQFPLNEPLSWLETRFVPHFKHFTLSVGLIWPHVWQCHCSTDAIEPILIHTWLWYHNNSSFYENKLRFKKNENSWSTMLFVYNFFYIGTRRPISRHCTS